MTSKFPEPTIKLNTLPTEGKTDWSSHQLIINWSKDHLQVGVLQKDLKSFPLLVQYCFEKEINKDCESILETVFQENNISASDCERVYLLFDTPQTTPIPTAIYQDEHKASYFNMLYGEQPEQRLFFDRIDRLQVNLIYDVNTRLIAFAKTHFKETKVFHIQSLLFSEKQDFSKHSNRAFIYLHPDFLTLTLLSEGKLRLLQSYKIGAISDIIYYVLNAFQQLNLDEKEFQIEIWGLHPQTEAIVEQLSEQLTPIHLLERSTDFQYPEGVNAYPTSIFHDLVSLALCES